MQYPEVTSATVEQAWPEPGSLKSRGGHHLEPQGFKGLFVSGTAGHFFPLTFFSLSTVGQCLQSSASWPGRPCETLY